MPADPLDHLSQARLVCLQRLQSLQRAGVTHIAKAKRPVTLPTAPDLVPSEAVAVITPSADEEQSLRILSLPERQVAMDLLSQKVSGCPRCELLATTRTQTVFGVGNLQARLCFIGEAPGADEDAQGVPFVGRAGQLLTKIIEACTLKRDDVYICNVLKCRPPGNRTPEPQEIANCLGYLERQLEVIRPEFICCLGAVAARTLLGSTASIGQLRGRFHDYRGIRVLCTYHPSYLLRNPSAKREVWEDMKILMAEMGIELK